MGGYGIRGHVINLPIDVPTMVQSLPRCLDDECSFNVNLKRNVIHKSSYLRGYVKKTTVRKWLQFLEDKPSYRLARIEIDWDRLNGDTSADGFDEGVIEILNPDVATESEMIHAHQQTMLWNDNYSLIIARGQNKAPLSILFDPFAEECAYPSVFLGVGGAVKEGIRATAFTHNTSEIRRYDRRGVEPADALYKTMFMFRLKLKDGIQNMFRARILDSTKPL